MSTKTYAQSHLDAQKAEGLGSTDDEQNCILLDEHFVVNPLINKNISPNKDAKFDDANTKNIFDFNLNNEKNFINIPNQILNHDFT